MQRAIVDIIADKFGGRKALAAAIAADETTIAHWKRRGIIPARQQQRILQAARERQIALAPADFFDLPPIQGEAAA